MATFTRAQRSIIRRYRTVYRNIWGEMDRVEYFGGDYLYPTAGGFLLRRWDGEELRFTNLHRALHSLCVGV